MKTPPTDRPRRKEARISFNSGPPRSFGKVLLEARIPSRLSLKNELILKVLTTLEKKGLATDKTTLARWRLCLDEALVNAIVHGNNGDPRRFVSLRLMSGKRRWGVVIEDEGKGFSPRQLNQANSAHALYSESGRGILIMRQFADDVRYYRSGSAVMLVKSTKPESTAAPGKEESTAAAKGGRKSRGSSKKSRGSSKKSRGSSKKKAKRRKSGGGKKKAKRRKSGGGKKKAKRRKSGGGKKKGGRSGS